MTQWIRNMNAGGPTGFKVRGIAALVLLALLFGLRPALVRAGDDLTAAIRIRTALDQDEQLRPLKLNLRVKITRGLVEVSGPVPSEEARRQVVRVVEQVHGVLKVRSNQLYVVKARKDDKMLSLPLEGEQPTQTRSASPDPVSGTLGTLTGRDPLTPVPTNPKPVVRPTSPQRTSVPVRVSTVPSASRGVTLLAPEAVTTPARAPEPARLTTNPRAPARTETLAAAIDRLRQGDEHFRTIRTEVRGTLVQVFAGDNAGEHVMAFAQAITRLAGVERVVVQDASSPPR